MSSRLIRDRFIFSQANLQDFSDCRRRFKLRYLDEIAWPALQTEPVEVWEAHTQMGERFHKLAQQYFMGVPEPLLTRQAEIIAEKTGSPDIVTWWQNFIEHFPEGLPELRFVEQTLSAPFDQYRLMARYDLLAVQPGEKLVIVDWKTTQQLPKRTSVERRLQTLVYRYLAIEAAQDLFRSNNDALTPTYTEGKIHPDQVEMVYWFPGFPHDAIRFAYSQEEHESTRSKLSSLVKVITHLGEDDFTLTTDERRCEYCVYRSLCDRGVMAGPWQRASGDDEASFDLEWDESLAVDLDAVQEVEF